MFVVVVWREGEWTGEDKPDQAGKNKRYWSYIKHQKSSNTCVAPLKKEAEEFELKPGMADRGIPTIDDIKI